MRRHPPILFETFTAFFIDGSARSNCTLQPLLASISKMHDKFKQLTDAGVPIRDGKKPSRVWQSRKFEKLANAKLDIC